MELILTVYLPAIAGIYHTDDESAVVKRVDDTVVSDAETKEAPASLAAKGLHVSLEGQLGDGP